MSHIITKCYNHIRDNIIKTPLEFNYRLSKLYNTNIFYKREDLQITRSFKLRGNLNKISKIISKDKDHLNKGFICASAGNHAQGFAFICKKFNLDGTIYVPKTTPLQKINRIKCYGENNIDIKLFGNNFDECLNKAVQVSKQSDKYFIHPYDDYDIIHGQGTIAVEVFQELKPDFIICPIGGGGLISGISKYVRSVDLDCKIIGVEPENAESMTLAIKNGMPTKLEKVDVFVDGASVPLVGEKTFEICRDFGVDKIYSVPNNKICYEMVNCYQDDGIILEPAGALSLSCLNKLQQDYCLEGKNVVSILSGGNNDITRYGEIMQLSLEYMGLIHYFIIEFSQTPGQLKHFINHVLCDNIDIIRLEYIKKTNKYYGKVLLGIQLSDKQMLYNLIDKFNRNHINYKKIEYNSIYYDILI